MARISELEFSGRDSVELALTVAEFNALMAPGSTIEYSVQQYDLTGSDAAGWDLSESRPGEANSLITFDASSTFIFDAASNEYLAVEEYPSAGGGFNFRPTVTNNAGYDALGLYSTDGGTDTPIQLISISADFPSVGSTQTISDGPLVGLADSDIENYDWTALNQPSGFNSLAFNQPDITNPVFEVGTGIGTSSGVSCFTLGTLITTANGEKPIEELVCGDKILTRDNGYQSLRWIGKNHFRAADLVKNPKLRPISIQSGSLGHQTPTTDLTISRQHRVLVKSKIVERMLNNEEVLVAAHALLPLDGVEVRLEHKPVTYFHLMCDQHQIILSNGAWTETLYAGKEALKSIEPQAREELFMTMPDLKEFTSFARPQSARVILEGGPRKNLVARHVQNQKPIFKEALH
ncbi:MAG: Hint domain-containing protein [Litoreibacter sp.]